MHSKETATLKLDPFQWKLAGNSQKCCQCLIIKKNAFNHVKTNRIRSGINKDILKWKTTDQKQLKHDGTPLYLQLVFINSRKYSVLSSMGDGRRHRLRRVWSYSRGRCNADAAFPSLEAVVAATTHSTPHWLPFGITKCTNRGGSFNNSLHS